MSLALTALNFLPRSLLMESAPRRGKGRPKNIDDPAKRERQIKYAGLVLAGMVQTQEAAAALDVDPRTIYRWIRDLLDDGRADTDCLRRLQSR